MSACRTSVSAVMSASIRSRLRRGGARRAPMGHVRAAIPYHAEGRRDEYTRYDRSARGGHV
jgi:hypothetical protein